MPCRRRLSKSGEGLDWAIREAAELLVQMIGPMLPHLGEDCWARLGYNTLLADQPWPEAEPALLVDDRDYHCRTGKWQETG